MLCFNDAVASSEKRHEFSHDSFVFRSREKFVELCATRRTWEFLRDHPAHGSFGATESYFAFLILTSNGFHFPVSNFTGLADTAPSPRSFTANWSRFLQQVVSRHFPFKYGRQLVPRNVSHRYLLCGAVSTILWQ